MTRKVFRDENLQTEFSKDGYVSVPMLGKDVVSDLLKKLVALSPNDNWHPDGSGLAQNSYHCTFLDLDTQYKQEAFELLEASFASVIDQYLEGYRALSANFYVKPTDKGQIPVHQNWPVLPLLDDTSVTVWCPLVHVSQDNGTLHVVPSSHKLMPHIEGPGSLSYFSEFRDDLHDMLVPLSADAGRGFIFDDSLVHGSPNNSAATPRIAVQITCIPADQKPVFYFRRDDGQFELIDADRDFYIKNSIADLIERQDNWPAGPIHPNENRQVTKTEFAARLAERKRKISSPPRGSLFQRIGRLLSSARTIRYRRP